MLLRMRCTRRSHKVHRCCIENCNIIRLRQIDRWQILEKSPAWSKIQCPTSIRLQYFCPFCIPPTQLVVQVIDMVDPPHNDDWWRTGRNKVLRTEQMSNKLAPSQNQTMRSSTLSVCNYNDEGEILTAKWMCSSTCIRAYSPHPLIVT